MNESGAQLIPIAYPSVASLLVKPQAREHHLATATGFVVMFEGDAYLVTNFHVVSGRNGETGETLDKQTAAWPDRLVIMHNSQERAGDPWVWLERTELLYEDGGNPRWLEHPVHGSRVDVVALRLSDLGGVAVHPYDPWRAQHAMTPMAHSLSIVGFPFGVSYGGSLAIWVQGFIATERVVDFGNLPRFLVDSRTRRGQSGSPVIFYAGTGTYTDVNRSTCVEVGEYLEFVGVYSGRINEQSDLGFVWKASALQEILCGGIRGTAAAP